MLSGTTTDLGKQGFIGIHSVHVPFCFRTLIGIFNRLNTKFNPKLSAGYFSISFKKSVFLMQNHNPSFYATQPIGQYARNDVAYIESRALDPLMAYIVKLTSMPNVADQARPICRRLFGNCLSLSLRPAKANAPGTWSDPR
jgi:hypothetical protein